MIHRAKTPRHLSLVLILGLALAQWRCSVNPATGRQQLSFYSEAEEIEIGRQNDAVIVAEVGLVDDPGLQSWIQEIGSRLAHHSERPNLPWTFRVLDDPVVNAFALPGGFVYVTRGILAHMSSEAELVGVLGHEIGHVTARHGVNQMSKQQLAVIGLGVGALLSEDVAEVAAPLSLGLGLLFLKFSRSDEAQADELGFRYASRSGYPPAAMAEVFGLLERVGQTSGAGAIPNWLASHPNPGNRRQAIEAKLAGLPPELQNAPWRSEPYLERIDGIVFGDDPRHGFFRGDRFYHPELRFQLDLPAGWQHENALTEVSAQSPGGDAALVLSLVEQDSPSRAEQAFFARPGIEAGGSWLAGAGRSGRVTQRFRLAEATSTLYGGVAFFEHEGKVFQLLAVAQEGAWPERELVLEHAVRSFAELKDSKILDVESMRLDLVRLDRDLTVEELAQRYPSAVELPTLALINHLEPGERLRAGTLAKRVVGAAPEG